MEVSRPSLPTFCLAVAGGVIAASALYYGGPLCELHERSHALAIRVLTTSTPTVHVNSWKAWNPVFAARGLGAKFAETTKVLLGYYSHNSHTAYKFELNLLGRWLGPDTSRLIITVAGPGSGLLVHSVALVGGLRLRTERPALATFLCSLAIMGHILTTRYPLLTLRKMSGAPVETAQNLLNSGNDFAQIAGYLDQVCGVPYSHAAYWLAVGWTVSLPLVGLWALTCESGRTGGHRTSVQWGIDTLLGAEMGWTLSHWNVCDRLVGHAVGAAVLPVLVHSAAMVVGMQQRKKRPVLATILIAFAIVGQLSECRFPLGTMASMVSVETANELLQKGDPFAVMIRDLSWRTGADIGRLASYMSIGWLVSVPLIGIGVSLFRADDEVDHLS